MKFNATIFRRLAGVAACSIVAGLIAGCASNGELKGQRTDMAVNLSQNNYRVIKAGVIGKSYGFRLLGILPLASPTLASAKADLYNSVGEPLTGKAVALANQTEDRSLLYLILFSVPKVTITADVIEFTDPAEAK